NKSMRYTETVVEQDAKVFVVGDCKVRKSGTPKFYKGDNPLLVTDKNEEELIGHYKRRSTWFLVGAIAVPLGLFGIPGCARAMIWRAQAPKRAGLTSPPAPLALDHRPHGG